MAALEQGDIPASEYEWKDPSRGKLLEVHLPVGSDEGSL